MNDSRLAIGKKVRVTSLGSHGQIVTGDRKKKNPVFKGKVVGIYKHFFNVDNGFWEESFRHDDIGIAGGIQIKYL